MATQPLALQWLCFIRDYGVDLKLSKESRVLASVLPTYGKGQYISVSMVTLAKVTGMKRDTVIKARRELIDRGLLEDITGNPERQSRIYALAMPGYVSAQGDTEDALKVSPERDRGVPLEGHQVSPERDTTSRDINNDINHDRELGGEEKLRIAEDISRGVASSGSRVSRDSRDVLRASRDSLAPQVWDERNRQALAGCLGVPLESIDEPFWSWLESLGLDLEDDNTNAAIYRAHVLAKTKRNPVGYFQKILPGFIDERRVA